MRVLIVDDEPKVRQHLRMLLNTRNVCEIAGEACDGAEALKMMDAAAPDIVITDIRMPRMDGLQLLKEIQRQGFTVGRIVLTGYGDFAYTRRAMQQGIRTYLLKPIDEAELWKAMEEAVQDLNHEKLIMHQLKCGEKQRRELQLLRLLQNRFAGETSALSSFAPCCAGRLFIIETLEEDGRSYSDVIEELQNETTVAAVVDETKIACYQSNCVHPEEEACLLRDVFSENDRSVTVAYGEKLSSIDSIAKSYQDICRLLNSKWLLPQNTILHTGMLPRADEPGAWKKIELWDHTALDEAIVSENMEEIRKQVGSLFSFFQTTPCNEQMKRALFTEELIHIMRSVSEKGGDANQALGGELNVVELLKTYDISALENWYASICRKVSQYLAAIRDRRPECVSERIMTMFQKNPSGSYSLHELARMFYMSPAYLGSTFKKEKGQTLHAWLTAERMEISKKALIQTEAPVYEIAEQCSYQNLRSFFTAFKKSENCTPSEYRERMKKQ